MTAAETYDLIKNIQITQLKSQLRIEQAKLDKLEKITRRFATNLWQEHCIILSETQQAVIDEINKQLKELS